MAATRGTKAPASKPAGGLFAGAIEAETDDNPFARGGRGTYTIDEDHEAYPLVAPFKETYDKQKAARVPTTDPDLVIAYLRRIATQEGKSVRVSVVTPDGRKVLPVRKPEGAEEVPEELKGKIGKFAPNTNGETVYVRFMGSDFKARPRKGKDNGTADNA